MTPCTKLNYMTFFGEQKTISIHFSSRNISVFVFIKQSGADQGSNQRELSCSRKGEQADLGALNAVKFSFTKHRRLFFYYFFGAVNGSFCCSRKGVQGLLICSKSNWETQLQFNSMLFALPTKLSKLNFHTQLELSLLKKATKYMKPGQIQYRNWTAPPSQKIQSKTQKWWIQYSACPSLWKPNPKG